MVFAPTGDPLRACPAHLSTATFAIAPRSHAPPRAATSSVISPRSCRSGSRDARTSTRSTSADSQRPRRQRASSARHACSTRRRFSRCRHAAVASPIAANDYQRTKVRGGARRGRAPPPMARRIVRLYPGVLYGPGVDSEGNLVGRLVRDHLSGRLPGLVGADRIWSYAWIDDVAAAHVARRRARRRRAPPTCWAARTCRRCASSRLCATAPVAAAAPPHSIRARRGRSGVSEDARRRALQDAAAASRAAPWRSSGTTGRSTARRPIRDLGLSHPPARGRCGTIAGRAVTPTQRRDARSCTSRWLALRCCFAT